jgi:hypothetical protein
MDMSCLSFYAGVLIDGGVGIQNFGSTFHLGTDVRRFHRRLPPLCQQ